MSEGQNEATIVVKKIVKGGGHHGGAWKVAYADFVTAMMAFFLLLWLLNVTTDEQKSGIADYFAPTVASQSTSGSGGILGGTTMSPDGARISRTSPPTIVVELTPPKQRNPSDSQTETDAEGELEEAELLKRIAEREQQQFREAEEMLRQAIQDVPDLAGLNKNLIVDNTPEGMRIQIVDQHKQSMFASGSADMNATTRKLMKTISEVVMRLPNRIAISGHTDSTPFRTANGYTNWELSSDRANASRRALIEAGLPPDRIATVSGKADTEPLIPEDPSLPSNRRISIVMLREAPVLPPDAGR